MSEVMTLRLSVDLYEVVRLEAYARGIPISAVVREAIDEYINKKRADPAWQQKARDYLARQQATFERLMGPFEHTESRVEGGATGEQT